MANYTPPSANWFLAHGLTPKEDPSSFARTANLLIPEMAAADRASLMTFLGSDAASAPIFGTYLNNLTPIPETSRADESSTRQYFQSSDRAKRALNYMEQVRGLSGVTEDQLGPGYKFLRQAINLLNQFGGTEGEGMTRASYEQLQTGLNALVTQAQSDRSLAPYAEMAQKFINPTLLGGSLMPSTNIGGRTIYGQASGKLFT